MQLGNLLEQGRITFAPNSTEVAGLVDHLLTKNQVSEYHSHFLAQFKNEHNQDIRSLQRKAGVTIKVLVFIYICFLYCLQFFKEVYGGTFPSEKVMRSSTHR